MECVQWTRFSSTCKYNEPNNYCVIKAERDVTQW